MKIYISTLNKLPETCFECPCHDSENGECKSDLEGRVSNWRPFWCPLVAEVEETDSDIVNSIYIGSHDILFEFPKSLGIKVTRNASKSMN